MFHAAGGGSAAGGVPGQFHPYLLKQGKSSKLVVSWAMQRYYSWDWDGCTFCEVLDSGDLDGVPRMSTKQTRGTAMLTSASIMENL